LGSDRQVITSTLIPGKKSMPAECPNCGSLTYKAKGQSGLNRVEPDSELWTFVSSWMRKFRDRGSNEEDPGFERFIFLWVSVNAWASMAVPDQVRNHEDAYLVHSMAQDPEMNRHFEALLENTKFHADATQLAALGPVFQVLWLRNHGVTSWQLDSDESRAQYVSRVFAQDPFHRPKQNVFPAFAPACALTHQSDSQPIPTDWPHLLHMIYQIRCNLFHGGKTYESAVDQQFVDLAFRILWAVWKSMIPSRRLPVVSWSKLFIRSGIRFEIVGREFSLANETPRNTDFVRGVLAQLGWESRLVGNILHPPSVLIEEAEWLGAWDKLSGGVEGGSVGFEDIELGIMDAHMSGIVRWLNALGFVTGISCDGHGKHEPWIRFVNSSDEAKVAALFEQLTDGRITLRDTRMVLLGRDRARIPPPHKLLELAEKLYGQLSSVRQKIGHESE
jgi:hypothetical protein